MKRTDVFINTKDCSLEGSPITYLITVSDQFYYEHYYGHRSTLSIGDVLPLHGIFEGAIICNIEHHAGDCGTPPPGHPGTTPSLSVATPIMVPEQEAPPAMGRPQRMTARLTMLGTL